MQREIEQGPGPPPGGLAQSPRQHHNAELEISNRPGHGDLGSSRDNLTSGRRGAGST